MRTIELKAYKFSELSKKAKEKALDNHRQSNVDDDWWTECTLDDWKEKLGKIGFGDAKIYFSGFWSQGDGACFNASINAYDFAKTHEYNELELKIIELCDPHYKIETVNHHYYHANTRDVQFLECYSYNGRECEKILQTPRNELPLLIGSLTEPEAEELLSLRLQSGLDIRPDLFISLEKDMEEARENLSNEIYRDLEKEYDYQTSDEVIAESLEANDREFDEEGNDI